MTWPEAAAEGCRHDDLYPLTVCGPFGTLGLGLRLHTHTKWTRSTKINGKLPTRLPQSNIQRIGLRRREVLGISINSARPQLSKCLSISRHIFAPPAARKCSDYSASCITAAAGEFQIALPAFDRPLQSSREGVTLNRQQMHITGEKTGIYSRLCAVSILYLAREVYELKYETTDEKRRSRRKQRVKRICRHSDFR